MGQQHSDPFRPAKLLVTLASADLDNFQSRCDSFIKECIVETFADYDSEPNQIIGKIRINSKIPDVLERDAMRFINELRSALDKCVHAAAKLLGSSDLAHAHFPLGDSESQFDGQLASQRGPWRGIPKELQDFLKALRPFWGGNDLLRAFGGFSNPTKHESILTVNVDVRRIGLGGEGLINAQFVAFKPVWNEAKTECEVFRLAKYPPPNIQIAPLPYVAFNDAQGLTGKKFVPAIRQITGIVDGIVLGIEAETNRILLTRT